MSFDKFMKKEKVIKRKVIVIESSPLGSNILETTYEELGEVKRTDAETKPRMRPKIPEDFKFNKSNKMHERLNIAIKPEMHTLGIFIHGGHHRSAFFLNERDVNELINLLIRWKKVKHGVLYR